MNELLISLIGAAVATNQPLAVSNLIQQRVGISVAVVNLNDPAEQELQKLMADDDDAQAEVDKWIRDNNAFAAQGAGESREELNRRILARFEPVRKGYEDLLGRYPNFARGHLAYGSFLNDIGEEGSAQTEFEKASQLDPKNPAAWNNLANYYGEHGPVTNAFVDYAKAIELSPGEPVYYHNLAMMVYLFRKDAMAFYGINEQQVFDKALALYRQAVQFDPSNFPLATDYAQSYYGIRPLRTNDALQAWTNALHIAHDEIEREGVYIHLARVKMAAGRLAEARAQLTVVTNSMYGEVKRRLERNLAERENAATNPGAAKVPAQVVAAPTQAPAVPQSALAAPTNAQRLEQNPAERKNLATNTQAVKISTNAVTVSTTPPAISPNAGPAPTNAVKISTKVAVIPAKPPVVSLNVTPAQTNLSGRTESR